MLKWLKKLKAIVAGYDADLRNAHARIAELEKLVRDRTNIAIDVEFKSASHVIVVGRYKNADYVQTYALDTPDFSALIDRLRDMQRYGQVQRIDAPPIFRAAFERDRGGYEF
ncbi:MAG: hypothetical protein IPN12_00190 [Rhodocyclaceae bacterium]|nr:hypothetical protein [Rhodocyclaceae bacterium]